MYMMVVHKFSEIGVPMVPRLSECMNNGRLDMRASNDRELESVHSLETLEMIREHLSTIRDWRGKFDATDNRTASRIPRLQLGRVYAASIMYGYFLKSASLRHRLELDFALTDEDLPPLGYGIRIPLHEFQRRGSDNVAVLGCPTDRISSLYQGSRRSRKTEELRGYVMGFDSEALQRCAKLKSREAVNLIEKHSWALFGEDGGAGRMEDDEVISVTFSSLKRLVLEAVAFGSFLWDVERYVDSIYSLKEN
ncbi:UV-B-induced protein At3g17800, chloroplastic-like isoform X2 [Magnolia sinica]|nr:UV-B-induced protein At3g17800, chloroplastic-like isoform X2 [Magnolia sinica]